MAAFASAYGTFSCPSLSASPPESTNSWGWDDGRGSGSGSSGSGPAAAPLLSSCAAALPVHYRCLLLLDEDGGVIGVRLRWVGGLLRVAAVTAGGVCQGVCEEDVVTHIDEESVQQLEQQEGGSGGGAPPLALLRSIPRRRLNPAAGAPPSTARSPPQRRAVVELRLIRARTLGGKQQQEEATSASPPAPAPSTPAAAAASAYARLQQSAGPVLLYETHARDGTLGSIAARFRTTAPSIRGQNREVFPPGEPGPPTVQPGLLLRILNPDYPCGMQEQGVPLTPERLPSTGAGAGAAASPSSSASSSTAEHQHLLQRREHVVAAGETLEGIAGLYGIPLIDLRRWNRALFPVGEPGAAVAGDRLLLFCRASAAGGGGGGGEQDKEERGKRRTKRRSTGSHGEGSAPIAFAGAGAGGRGTSGGGNGGDVPLPE